MSHEQNISDQAGKFYTAIVVRDQGNEKKVFHKYHNIPKNDRKIDRFQRVMYWLHADQGRLIHINYYDKDTRQFVFRWKCSFD